MIAGVYKKVKNPLIRARLKSGSNQYRINYLKKQGVKIGNDCLIFTFAFSTEPYLVEIGNHVVVSNGTIFITHDGSVWLFRKENPNLTIFGKITIGDNTFIGMNCIILPNSEIGSNCIIGAGSVVRGKIPDDSVVMGNPAKVVMKTSVAEKFMLNNRHRVDTKQMTPGKRKIALLKHFNI
ncbi:MAG: acyltransferase [Bacteroidales bacterium]|nr:acyltransferase [Bacteroidales bacterium]